MNMAKKTKKVINVQPLRTKEEIEEMKLEIKRENKSKKTKKVNNVKPLRTKEEIEEMKLAIKRGNKGTSKRMELAERDILIFLLGINTGLRVNDLVKLKVEDVKGKQAFFIKEGK